MKRTLVRLKRKATAATLRKILLGTNSHDVDGMQVYVSDPRIEPEQALAKLTQALAVLEIDPHPRNQVAKYCRQIVIWLGGHTAYDRLDGVHLSAEYLLGEPPEIVAAALVHEAAHLRIEQWGISYHPDVRARIEQICTRKQAAFLRKFHDEALAARAADLETGLSSPWWTREARQKRVRRSLEREGIPGWLSRFMRWR